MHIAYKTHSFSRNKTLKKKETGPTQRRKPIRPNMIFTIAYKNSLHDTKGKKHKKKLGLRDLRSQANQHSQTTYCHLSMLGTLKK